MNSTEPGDANPGSDAPKELELDDSFEEQKKQVDAWEEDMRKEREERSREESGSQVPPG